MDKKILSCNLNKYNSTEKNFINNRINNIIFPKKSRFLSIFLDNLIYNDYTDFVSTFYSYNLSKIYFNKILLFQKQKYYFPCYIESNINLILKQRYILKKKIEKKEEINIKKQFQVYTQIFTSNFQDSKSIFNNISQNSETIENLGVNDDITLTIDLNINKKYDYKELDKNIDFINNNNSNNENNTIGELLSHIIKNEKVKKKPNYVEIRKSNKNNNFLNHNKMFHTQMKKKLISDENNKNKINIKQNNHLSIDRNIIKNQNNNKIKRKNNYQIHFNPNINNYSKSKTRKNSDYDVETQILLTEKGIKANNTNIFLCITNRIDNDDNKKNFKEIIKKENKYKISETLNNNSLATTSNSISNQLTPICNKFKNASLINITNNKKLRKKIYSKNKKKNNPFTINLKKQLSRNIYYSKALENFSNKFIKTSEK